MTDRLSQLFRETLPDPSNLDLCWWHFPHIQGANLLLTEAIQTVCVPCYHNTGKRQDATRIPSLHLASNMGSKDSGATNP